jgi:hypothetical protein
MDRVWARPATEPERYMQALKHCQVLPASPPPPARQRQVSVVLLAQVSEQKAPVFVQAIPSALAGHVIRTPASLEPPSAVSQP